MNQALFLGILEIKETLRARWYQFYCLTLVVLISSFFYFGLAESRALGFTGLGRLLLTLVQVCIIILPIFTMMTTVRTLVGDRESGVWEYNLSLPIKLYSFYWGRAFGRFIALFLPLAFGMLLMALLTKAQGHEVPWKIIFLYTLFMGSNLLCFTGLALCLSVFSRSQEAALGVAFICWLVVEALIDVLLLGIMLKRPFLSELVVGLAFFNPLQAFRMAAIGLFDPELTVLGPIAYTIIEKIGLGQVLAWAVVWPSLLGLLLAWLGYVAFSKKDLL